MNKLLIFLISILAVSLEAATITNWGSQLPTAAPVGSDVILMQKGGVTYYFTPNQLAANMATNAQGGITNKVDKSGGVATNLLAYAPNSNSPAIKIVSPSNTNALELVNSTNGRLAYLRPHTLGDGLFPSFPTQGMAGAFVVANTQNSNYLAMTEYQYGASIQWRNDFANGLEFHVTQANGSGGAVATMIGDDTQNLFAVRNTSDTGDINMRWTQAWGVFDINTTGPITDILIDPNSAKLRIQAFLLPEVNATYDLGTNNLQWRDLWVSRNIVLGATSATTKLDVKADGNTSATYAFGVRNASDIYYLIGRDDGRVGIGTITPGAVLDVFQAPGTTGQPIFHAGTNAANGITVSSNGNFGIKTATPSSPLTVTGDAEISGVLYDPTIRVTTLSDYLGASANASIAFAGASKYINFVTDGTERMRVSSTGAVGIGTTTPSSHLDVTGQVRSASAIITNSVSLLAKAFSAPASTSFTNAFGAHLWSDGTNLCVVLEDSAGTRTTNKLSMTAWP